MISLPSLVKLSWAQIFFSMLTQLSAPVSFPSYNLLLGLLSWWITSCSAGRRHYISLFFVLIATSILFDVIFCSVWGTGETNVFNLSSGGGVVIFCLSMLVVNMFVKTTVIIVVYRTYFMGSTRNGSPQKDYSLAR